MARRNKLGDIRIYTIGDWTTATGSDRSGRLWSTTCEPDTTVAQIEAAVAEAVEMGEFARRWTEV